MSLREAWPQGALNPLGHVRHTGGLQAAAPKPSSAVRGLLEQFVLSDSRAPAAAPCKQLAQDNNLLLSQQSPEREHSHVWPRGL